MKLTNNFWLSEFAVSSDYPELAKEITFDDYEKSVVKLLCESVLQPIRDEFGVVHVTSGKRTPELNAKVGGTALSDHLTCNAADIYLPEVDIEYVIDWIDYMAIPYRQMKRNGINGLHLSINIPGKTFKNEYVGR